MGCSKHGGLWVAEEHKSGLPRDDIVLGELRPMVNPCNPHSWRWQSIEAVRGTESRLWESGTSAPPEEQYRPKDMNKTINKSSNTSFFHRDQLPSFAANTQRADRQQETPKMNIQRRTYESNPRRIVSTCYPKEVSIVTDSEQ